MVSPVDGTVLHLGLANGHQIEQVSNLIASITHISNHIYWFATIFLFVGQRNELQFATFSGSNEWKFRRIVHKITQSRGKNETNTL